MRHALSVGLLMMAACKGKPAGGSQGSGSGSAGGAEVKVLVAPVDMAQAKVTLGCLFDRARTEREVLTVLAENAPAPLVRMAGLAAIDRAREDGETPAINMMVDVLDQLAEVEDLDGMRAVFAQLDAIPSAKGAMRTNNLAPLRARVGLPVAAADISSEPTATVRELALAGKLPEAQALYATLPPVDTSAAYYVEGHIGALAALGKTAEIGKLIAGAKDEDRLKLAGLWLETVLRGKGPAADAIAEVRAQIAVAPPRGVTWFAERKLFRRAKRAGRAAELGPVYAALKARYTKDGLTSRLAIEYDLARAMGDAAEVAMLARDPALAEAHALRTAVFDRVLGDALAKKYPNDDLVRLWERSVVAPADGAWGVALAAKVCPKPARPRDPATPAQKGLTVTVTEKAKKTQFECANHDLVVRLMSGDKKLGEEILEGECHGACTAAEQREGRKQLAEIEAAIAKGEASESQTDYNFTQCLYAGPNPGRIDTVGDRSVALLIDHYIGPHDIDKDRYQLALEVCGELHVTQTFGQTYAGGWDLKELAIRESADKQSIVVEGTSERWTGVLFRMRLPACPGTPDEESIELEM